MFASLFDVLNTSWFWFAFFTIAAIIVVAREISKTASNPYVQVGAKGFWSLFK
jgi:hypothetical protein